MAKPAYVYDGAQWIQIASAVTDLSPYVLRAPEVNVLTGNYTLVLGDQGKILKYSGSTPITITVPVNTTANLPLGSTLRILQAGTGQISVIADTGVTLNTFSVGTKLSGQWAEATLTNHYLNEWVINGTLSA